MNSFGERLKEERERLGLSQEAFGAIGGVQKLAQRNYEKDNREPNASYMAALSEVGVDVMYILTGQKEHFSGYTDEHIRKGVAQYLVEALDMGMFELNKGVSFDFAVELAQQCIRKTAGLSGVVPASSAKTGSKKA
ncbi:helix-turn-helix domain-containing protein [Rheinheimera maricola]|uniref:Helix-turn-helix domain-containing protein n=1 Tax=Rheinheimera maricola TaxID=2793282 RepID=A0ABS7X5G6_9GAMM|nr:helix-turn-helix transcriptional regulator [Rheinheimera maricola]MBZ9610786.1 helix-turn-helix domain-containing protein [Rheinheimera maricola]